VSERTLQACCFLWLLLVSAGCHSARPAAPPVLNWSADLESGAAFWMPSLKERFGKDVVVVSCHGNSRGKDLWLFPDPPLYPMHAETVAQLLKQRYGDRPIVLLSCNPDGRTVRVRGVWYAKKTVSAWPYLGLPGWVNRADELVEGDAGEGPLPPATQTRSTP
jgi:hypothetical protein